MPIPDLWPEDIGLDTNVLMPVNIMREQAAKLTERTKGLLEGQIDSSAPAMGSKDFMHTFYIVAPALDNYRHILFWVLHEVTGYPVSVGAPGEGANFTAEDQESFVAKLKAIFADEKTKTIIQALLAQSSS